MKHIHSGTDPFKDHSTMCGSAAQRHVMGAILEAGEENSRRNSSGKVHSTHDDS
jgi:hypothetical protein